MPGETTAGTRARKEVCHLAAVAEHVIAILQHCAKCAARSAGADHLGYARYRLLNHLRTRSALSETLAVRAGKLHEERSGRRGAVAGVGVSGGGSFCSSSVNSFWISRRSASS